MTEDLDRWLSPQIRGELEQLYYAEVNRQARFEVLRNDPIFLEALRLRKPHIGFYSDHGIVHVRDVARQVLATMERVHGQLIPQRGPWRFTSMKGYGVLLAYIHDIGMFDFSPFGRDMHPEFACHSIFKPRLDGIIEAIWRENSANLAWRLTQLEQDGALNQDPRIVLRELLALAMGHSKSKVPIDALNDRVRLRQTMIEAISTDLFHLHCRQQIARAARKLDEAKQRSDAIESDKWAMVLRDAEQELMAHQTGDGQNPDLHRYYGTSNDSFACLTADHPALRELTEDAIDTVRVLRCADALRQRGHVLKTSGEYEIFVSRETATAIISFQSINGQVYLFESENPISAGEANIASSELDADCNLRISFFRSDFNTPEATEFAVRAAAQVVEDIQQDTIGSFQRPAVDEAGVGIKRAEDMRILLEEVDNAAKFVNRIRRHIETLNPSLRGSIRLVPSLHETSERERTLYLAAAPVAWDLPKRNEFLQRLGRAGHRVDEIDPATAFHDVRLIDLRPGDILVEAGAQAGFVYIPMGTGLRVFPLGGYDAITAQPWTPLGATGVIRGGTRNATIVSEEPLTLLVIPKGIYLREWHRTHTPESFLRALEEIES